MPMGPDGWEMLTAPVVILSGHRRYMAPTRDMLQSLWYTHMHSQDFVLLHSYLPHRQKVITCYWCYLWLTHMHSHDFLLLRRYLPQNSVLGTCYWCYLWHTRAQPWLFAAPQISTTEFCVRDMLLMYLWHTHVHSHDFLLLHRYLPQNSAFQELHGGHGKRQHAASEAQSALHRRIVSFICLCSLPVCHSAMYCLCPVVWKLRVALFLCAAKPQIKDQRTERPPVLLDNFCMIFVVVLKEEVHFAETG